MSASSLAIASTTSTITFSSMFLMTFAAASLSRLIRNAAAFWAPLISLLEPMG